MRTSEHAITVAIRGACAFPFLPQTGFRIEGFESLISGSWLAAFATSPVLLRLILLFAVAVVAVVGVEVAAAL